MDAQPQEPSADGSSRYVLEGPELVQYLVQRAAEDAKAALIERDERRNRRMGILMSIVALVGVGGLVNAVKLFVRSEVDVLQDRFREQSAALGKQVDERSTALRNEFRAKVDQSVSERVDAKIGDVLTTLQQNDQFDQYAELAAQLPDRLDRAGAQGDKDRYVADALREVILAAETLADAPRITRRARFVVATRQIVDVMTRYNRESEINRLDDLLGEVLASDQEMARKLADHYGQLVIGSPHDIDALADEMPRLQRYLRSVKERNYPEKALLWTLFVEFKRNNYVRNPATDRLLESSRDLSEIDRSEFWYTLLIYTDPMNWMMTSTQQGRELARLMEQLQQQYRAEGLAGMMQQNLDSHPQLQSRLAELRSSNPNWSAAPSAAPAPAVAEEQTPPPANEAPANATAPRGNPLR